MTKTDPMVTVGLTMAADALGTATDAPRVTADPPPKTRTHYPIRVEPRFRLLLRVLFGVTPDRAWVTLDDELVIARLGWWQIEIPVAEIASWGIEGPWRWITAVGVRRSLRHGDISFAGSPRGGVRLDLRRPIHWTIFDVPAVYLGVEDLDGFVSELSVRWSHLPSRS